MQELTERLTVKAIETTVFTDGSEGGVELAQNLVELCENDNEFKYLYDEKLPAKEKLDIIAKEIYRAREVVYTQKAEKEIIRIESLGYGDLPICVAKTPYSLSDDPNKNISAKDYEITIRDVRVNAGAGFLVAYTDNVLTMPGLPKEPNAYQIDIDENGEIVGLF